MDPRSVTDVVFLHQFALT